jgi:release factor glutamine methyltransferase
LAKAGRSPPASCPPGESTGRTSAPRASSVTIAEALNFGAACLREHSIENPRLEARLLLAHALACPPSALLLDPSARIDPTAYRALLARRGGNEPLAYILGHREFWSLDFAVSPATLIPRPDSETVVEAALAAFPDRTRPLRVLDLGTGTGCLLLAVLHERPAAFGIGVDIGPEAAALAARNAATLGLADRAAFLCADWTTSLCGRFDLVLSNPPYITTSDLEDLMPEVGRFEPRTALDGGPDGGTSYRRIIAGLTMILAEDGIAVLELGVHQAEMVAKMAAERGFRATVRPDLAGHSRAIILSRGSP